MPDFSVRTDLLNSASGSMSSYSKQVQNIAESARNILKDTRSSIIQRLGNSGKSNVVYSSISSCSQDLNSLSNALSTASEIYQNYEKHIFAKDVSHPVGTAAVIAGTAGVLNTTSTIKDIIENFVNVMFGGNGGTEKGENSWWNSGNSFFKKLSECLRAAGEYGKNSELKLASPILGVLSSFCGVAASGGKSGSETVSSIASLLKNSGKTWSGLYNHLEKGFSGSAAIKFSEKFGKVAQNVSMVSSVFGIVEKGADAYGIFADPESTKYDKAAGILEVLGATSKASGDIYKASKGTSKILQFVNPKGSRNQILAQQKLELPAAVKDKIGKVTAYANVGNVIFSTFAGASKRYGQVSADGTVDITDWSSILIHGSTSGIDKTVNLLTFGVVDFDSEGFAGNVESDAKAFAQGDSWAARYIRNKNNNTILRFGVSVGSGAYVLGENVIEGVANTAKNIAEGVSNTAKSVASTVSDVYNYLFGN